MLSLLRQLTIIVDLSAMAICLWMACYLFIRGHSNKITLRAVIIMLSLSAYYFSAYSNVFHQTAGSASWRASFLIIAFGMWYSITLELLPANARKSTRKWEVGVYAFGIAAILLLLGTRSAFTREIGNSLYAAHASNGFPFTLYSAFLIVTSGGLLYNLLSHNKIGLTSQGRYFLLASIFPAIQVINGIVTLGFLENAPRAAGDFLIFIGVFFLGVSVARHQTWIERRTVIQDFPISSLTVLTSAALYSLLALRFNLPEELLAPLVALVVLTHAAYDMVHEILERIRLRKESQFRHQLRQFGNDIANEEVFNLQLMEILENLCNTIHASSGFIATRQGNEFVVNATQKSLPLKSRFPESLISGDEPAQMKKEPLSDIEWLIPAQEGPIQVAVIGVGKPRQRFKYSEGNVELLEEVADQIATLVSLNSLRPVRNDQIQELLAESNKNSTEFNAIAGEVIENLAMEPDIEFIKLVEDGLRHFADSITLGQSSLAEQLKVEGTSHIERGKALQQLLVESIESLKPSEKRPPEPLPRVWYSYSVLHDAYIEGVPNREIMARLYVSEGTFNRTRRNALRGLSRLLIEKTKKK